jgi:hypothetical protein
MRKDNEGVVEVQNRGLAVYFRAAFFSDFWSFLLVFGRFLVVFRGFYDAELAEWKKLAAKGQN